MKLVKLFTTAALITAVSVQPALAQQGQYQQRGAQMQGMQQQAQVDINDREVERYVEARQKITQISQQARGDMANMGPEEQQALNQKLVEAVKDTGLSVEKYNQITAAMQQDRDLQQRIAEAMNES